MNAMRTADQQADAMSALLDLEVDIMELVFMSEITDDIFAMTFDNAGRHKGTVTITIAAEEYGRLAFAIGNVAARADRLKGLYRHAVARAQGQQ